MGKRGSRSRSQLLSTLTKKQKKHLRDFGEEHPSYDKISKKEAKPQICQLSESSDDSNSESEAESEPEQVSGYHKLLATLKSVSEEEEEDEEEDNSAPDEAEVNSEDGGSDVSLEEETAAESAELRKGKVLPADPEEKDGEAPPGTSEESPEEFTDAKHESLFSLETNFLEEEGGANCSLKASQEKYHSLLLPTQMSKQKRLAYKIPFKLEVIKYAKKHGNRAAERHFGSPPTEKMIREWIKQEDQLQKADKSMHTLRGHAAKWPELDVDMKEWITRHRNNGFSVSTKMIIYEAKRKAVEKGIQDFTGSPSWCYRFMKRCGLAMRTKTRLAQEMPK